MLQEHFGIGGYTKGQWMDTQFSPELIDARLSPKGIEQCQVAAEHAAKVDFAEVWVSPMRRCIETAFHIFRNHPKIAGMRFVV